MSIVSLTRKREVAAPPAELGSVLRRISTATSVIRTRAEDTVRDDRQGGTSADVRARLEAAAAKLESVAASLEASVA